MVSVDWDPEGEEENAAAAMVSVDWDTPKERRKIRLQPW